MADPRTAVVVGGTSGIGRAIALRFAQDGFRLVVAGRDRSRGDRSAADCRAAGAADAAFLEVDVGDPESLAALARDTERRLGAPGVLVNCAGILQSGRRVLDQDLAEDEAMWRVNYRGTLVGSQVFGRLMSAAGRGAILNVGSLASFAPLSLPAYTPGKYAVLALTQMLAAELGPDGVRVNAVAPGYTLSDGLKDKIAKGERNPDAIKDNDRAAAVRRAERCRRGRLLPVLRSRGRDHRRNPARGRRLAGSSSLCPLSARQSDPIGVGQMTKRKPLSAVVAESLAAKIRSDGLIPGAQLPTEAELCLEYDVSRTVIREAVARLRSEGLVIPHQGRGMFVSDLSPRNFSIPEDALKSLPETIAIMELRMSVEVEAAGLCAERRTPHEAHAIRALMEQVDARHDDPNAVQIHYDYDFHLAIAKATGNEFIHGFLIYLRPMIVPRYQLGYVVAPEWKNSYYARIHKEHRAIVDAIDRQDSPAARRTMRRHLANSLERVRGLAEAAGISALPEAQELAAAALFANMKRPASADR